MGGDTYRTIAGAAAAMLVASCASQPAPEVAPATPQPAPSALPSAPSQAPVQFTPDPMLRVCPLITATNAPTVDAQRNIVGYKPYALVNGVRLAIAPVRGGCLTSGYGLRGGGTHKGIDIQTKPASMIHAAASGKVREAGFRADYGNQIVIDHGGGVFTRYAHLATIEPSVVEGAELPFGARLGVMGATAAYSIPLHLHYEVLTGNYETQKKSFGLTPVNVFDQPMSAG